MSHAKLSLHWLVVHYRMSFEDILDMITDESVYTLSTPEIE